MKRIILYLLLVLPLIGNAQTRIITTLAGNGTVGYSGDGGPATAAEINHSIGIDVDNMHNVYVADLVNNCIRKITPTGIITTIAGSGGVSGFAGDGGPATAALLNGPSGVKVDNLGNIYIADIANDVVRKIDNSGIISTIIGNGTLGYSGDGGPATAAMLDNVRSIAIDNFMNIYISCNKRIRKIDTSGIITTVVGNGIAGYSGDGGAATAAKLSNFQPNIAIDRFGNIYICDHDNHRIRKVDTFGIITTIAGNGSNGFSGDGGPAINARLSFPYGVNVDVYGNIYIADASNSRIRKVNTYGIISTIAGNGVSGYSGDGGPAVAAALNNPSSIKSDNLGTIWVADFNNSRIRKIESGYLTSDSFSVQIENYCGGIQLSNVSKLFTVGQHIATHVSSGYSFDTTTTSYGINGFSETVIPVAFSGNYVIKQILYDGIVPIDSIMFTQQYSTCQNMTVNFYFDANANCTKDTNERLTLLPTTVEIDSNGYSIDTVSCTSGIYYNAYGVIGDIYSFRVLNPPSGLLTYCPSSGVISDTVQYGMYDKPAKYFGLSCSTGFDFDLAEFSSLRAGRHMSSGTILVNNPYCNAQTTTVTMNFSPDYVFESAHPTPISVIGNTITWSLGSVAANLPQPPVISFTLNTPTPGITSTWLAPGTPVNSVIIANPRPGDVDTATNVIIRTDTVKSSYDPNAIEVLPQGYIITGTKLKYTIHFENTGNDTAHSIYVMDTLSPNVDPASLRLVAASAVMNIAIIYSGGYNIVKFDFPGINLLDSSHHNQCDGMVIYTINTKTGLADGTEVINHAGIYFDDNPVVMTDTAVNIISQIQGNSVFCEGDVDTLSVLVSGGIWNASNGHATISSAGIITAISAGIDTIKYIVTYATQTISTQKIVTINPLPHAGTITGIPIVCEAAVTTLSNTTTGGIWSSSNASAGVTGGVVSGITAGSSIISYSVTNSCGTAIDTMLVTVNPLPIAGTITGTPVVCESVLTTLTNTATGGIWSSSSSSATITGGIVTGVSAGSSIISYVVTNSCGTAIDTMMVTVNPLPHAGTITGTPIVCATSVTTLSNATTGGIWSSSTASATVAGGIVTGVSAGNSIISYSFTNSCGTDVDTMMVTINPLPNAGTITGVPIVCAAALTTLSNIATGGLWSSSSSSATVAGGVVSGVSAGSAIISYSTTNSCGTAIDTMMVTVNPLPVGGTITGTPIVCEAAVTTLVNTATGGTWSSSTTAASVVGGVVSGITAGTTIISYSVTNSCGTATDTMMVTVNPLPYAGSLAGVSPICIGTTMTISTTIASGTWSISNSNAIVTGGVVTGVAAGNVTISYSISNSCGTADASLPIVIEAVLDAGTILGFANVCEGETITLTTTSPTPGTWSEVTGNTSVTGGVVTGINPGIDTVRFVVNNSCGSDIAEMVVLVKPCNTGIAATTEAISDVCVFPNPTTGSFVVDLQQPTDNVTVTVMDITGKILQVIQPTGATTQVPVSPNNVASGTYLIKVEADGKVYRVKMVVW